MMISDRINNLGESATIKMAAIASELKAQGKDVISLSLGEPDFATPDFIKDAAKKAIDENYSYYSPVPGYPDLREAICRKLKRDNGLDYTKENIVVSTGAKHSLMNLFLSLVNPGDDVLIPAPYWVSYFEMARFAEGRPVIIKSDIETDFKITPAQLEKSITAKSKVFVFSNPSNPTGSIYSEKELADLAEVFAKHPHIVIISDEIYEYINFGLKTVSMASFKNIKDQVVVVNGLSKGFAMTGWRMGYIAAHKTIAKACDKVQGQFTSGANTITQRAAITALDGGYASVEYMQKSFLERRDLFLKLLEGSHGVKFNRPMGAFYLFPDIRELFGKSYQKWKIENTEDLCSYLLESQLLATTPGDAFGSPTCIRLSYANSIEQLKEAAKRFKEAINLLS